MSYFLEFILPGLPKTGNRWSRTHHFVWQKENSMWKTVVGAATCGRRPVKPLDRAKLTLTRYSSSEIDYDGLVASFKSIVDGLVDCGVLQSDKISATGAWDCRWEKCKRGEGYIRVKVESVAFISPAGG